MGLEEHVKKEKTGKKAGIAGKKNTPGKKRGGNKKYMNPFLHRAAALRRIASMRADRAATAGYRDIMCLIYYCALRSAGFPDDEALAATLGLNRLFDCPLPEKELVSAMSAARRKPYWFSNRRIIDMLALTEEEQKQTGLLPMGKREREKNKKRERKEKRNRLILELVSGGMSVTEAAKKARCSRSTAYHIVGRAGRSHTAPSANPYSHTSGSLGAAGEPYSRKAAGRSQTPGKGAGEPDARQGAGQSHTAPAGAAGKPDSRKAAGGTGSVRAGKKTETEAATKKAVLPPPLPMDELIKRVDSEMSRASKTSRVGSAVSRVADAVSRVSSAISRMSDRRDNENQDDTGPYGENAVPVT